jgi:hypothetical protein
MLNAIEVMFFLFNTAFAILQSRAGARDRHA